METTVERDEATVAAELARRIAAGDAAAEAQMVERYSTGLRYLLRHLTGDPALAEDLHQETFRAVLEKVRDGALREPERLAAFLRGTARNLTYSARRRSHRDEELPESADPADPGAGQLARLLRAEEAALVRRMIEEMRSERDRQVLVRFCLAEEDKEAICADLGLTALQFNVVLFRARQRFKQLYEQALRRRA